MNLMPMSSAAAEPVVPTVSIAAKASPKASAKASPKSKKPLHRIQEVRIKQGVSLRTAARHLDSDIRSVRQQEEETTDLRLSELYQWQRVLDVPVTELLTDVEEPLSRPVWERARMVRVMKTAQAILEKAPSPTIKRMAQMLVEQLVEVMPELEGVSPWHSVGQRRSLDEMGRIAEHTVSAAEVYASDAG